MSHMCIRYLARSGTMYRKFNVRGTSQTRNNVGIIAITPTHGYCPLLKANMNIIRVELYLVTRIYTVVVHPRYSSFITSFDVIMYLGLFS